MKNSRRLAAICASIIVMSTATWGAPSQAARRLPPESFEYAVDNYQAQHPLDFTGLTHVYARYGYKLLSVTNSDLGIDDADPESAQRRADEVGILSVPTDAFTVSGYISQNQYTGVYTVTGSYNFRDNYVNGSSPDDVAELAQQSSCYSLNYSALHTYDYQGTSHDSLNWIRATSFDGSVQARVRDTVSGFMLLTDHGSLWNYMKWNGGCTTRDFSAYFRYEHNQDGGSISSVSFSFWGLSVSYSGGPSALQKSTSMFH